MPGELFTVYTNRRNHMSVPVYNCVKEVKMGPSLFFVRDQSEWTRNWPLPLMFNTDKKVHLYLYCIRQKHTLALENNIRSSCTNKIYFLSS